MINKPKGTMDKLPSEVEKWRYVEEKFREICHRFAFNEIRTPLFEYTKLFKRGVGETTDIVKKEMFTVISDANLKKYNEGHYDLNKKGFTLKPEGTAPVVRSFVENKLYADAQPTKLFYITPCYRNENPQAGRLREFHQFGIETFSSNSAMTDAEVIAVAMQFFKELGLKDLKLKINSVGCKKCRPLYNQALKEYLKPRLDKFCSTCQERYETNPLRVLDCKVQTCQDELIQVPKITDHLCDDCKNHFKILKQSLEAFDIPYEVDYKIVRGLDYYTKTAFEIIASNIGSQSTICGGGRYDGLVQEIGGPEITGVGFGLGIERLIMTLEAEGISFPDKKALDVFVVILGEKQKLEGLKIVNQLRINGATTDFDHLDRSLKAQMRYANKLKSKFTIILGENELESGIVNIKNMENSNQIKVKIEDIIENVKELLGGK
ncbi:MAG: histidine--tRNA ligase [Clostridiales bacterium]|nr:histidine--tRNA ligase [Clostridiales bacterium]